MDGFRERLSGRYDRGERAASRGERYERSSEDRYERAGRREGLTAEAVTGAVEESNKKQLEVIMDLFDDAKADRLDSEKIIIDTITESIKKEVESIAAAQADGAASDAVATADELVVSDENRETLSRIERMTSQNAEAISESSEMLERSVNSLRSNTELINDIKGGIGEISQSIYDSSARAQQANEQIAMSLQSLLAAQQMPQNAGDNSEVKEEILSAVGDNRALLNMIRQDILNGMSRPSADEEEESAEESSLSAEAAEAYFKNIEEFIHKESVKCYKNVSASINEQAEENVNKLTKSVSGIRTIAGISLALNVFTLAVLVCYILGFFTI